MKASGKVLCQLKIALQSVYDYEHQCPYFIKNIFSKVILSNIKVAYSLIKRYHNDNDCIKSTSQELFLRKY